MDENFENKSEALIALATEMKCDCWAIPHDSDDEESCLNYLATICAEAWKEEIALTWIQRDTHVDLLIASSLPFTDKDCFKDHLKELWRILCQARTEHEAGQGSDPSGWANQVKNKVLPRFQNQLSRYLDECRSSVERLCSLASTLDRAFVGEAIKVISESNRSHDQVRDIFDNVCRHAEGWKDILLIKEEGLPPLDQVDGLISRVSDLNAAMEGLVNLFVRLEGPSRADTLTVHLLDPLARLVTLPSSSREEDWAAALPAGLTLTLSGTEEALESAFQNLSVRGTRKESCHPALVLFTRMHSWKLVPKEEWKIGSSEMILSRMCRIH